MYCLAFCFMLIEYVIPFSSVIDITFVWRRLFEQDTFKIVVTPFKCDIDCTWVSVSIIYLWAVEESASNNLLVQFWLKLGYWNSNRLLLRELTFQKCIRKCNEHKTAWIERSGLWLTDCWNVNAFDGIRPKCRDSWCYA